MYVWNAACFTSGLKAATWSRDRKGAVVRASDSCRTHGQPLASARGSGTLAHLVEAFRQLPQSTAGEVGALVRRLATLRGTKIDWADSWSDEDLRQYTERSLERLENAEGE